MELKSLPEFKRGVHFKELTPEEGDLTYRYVTLEPVTICFKRCLIPRGKKIQFNDISGKKWMVITPFTITIFPNYAWDGCTPKWVLHGRWVGVPDFKETILASLVHDALIQFESTKHFPFTRETRDAIFYHILDIQDFKYKTLYTLGVNFGSFIFRRKKNPYVNSLTIYPED